MPTAGPRAGGQGRTLVKDATAAFSQDGMHAAHVTLRMHDVKDVKVSGDLLDYLCSAG
jgi:hypothetical protein